MPAAQGSESLRRMCIHRFAGSLCLLAALRMLMLRADAEGNEQFQNVIPAEWHAITVLPRVLQVWCCESQQQIMHQGSNPTRDTSSKPGTKCMLPKQSQGAQSLLHSMCNSHSIKQLSQNTRCVSKSTHLLQEDCCQGRAGMQRQLLLSCVLPASDIITHSVHCNCPNCCNHGWSRGCGHL